MYDGDIRIHTEVTHDGAGKVINNQGIGEASVNYLLSTLEIRPVNHPMLDESRRGAGLAVETVAAISTEVSLQKEQALTKEKTCEEKLSVRVDAGWRKRGSGKTHDIYQGQDDDTGDDSGDGQRAVYIVSISVLSACLLLTGITIEELGVLLRKRKNTTPDLYGSDIIYLPKWIIVIILSIPAIYFCVRRNQIISRIRERTLEDVMSLPVFQKLD